MALPSSELTIIAYGSADLDAQRAVLLDIYEDVYAERLGDPFFSTARYWDRLLGYASRDGFAIAIGMVATNPIGCALGYALPAGSGWWRGLKSNVEEAELQEDGNRTFALTEIMVRAPWRRRG